MSATFSHIQNGDTGLVARTNINDGFESVIAYLGNKTPQVLVDGATVSWNYSSGYNAEVTINGNRALTITGATAGDYGTFKIIQGSSSNYVINFATASNKFPSATYSFSTTQGRWDIYGFYYDGTYFNWSFNKNYY